MRKSGFFGAGNIVVQTPLSRPFGPNGGHAFTASIPQAMQGCVETFGAAVLLEEGRPLGPADVQHIEIRNRGHGCYSVWKDQVYFSASDNTDCNDNGRSYVLVAVDLSRNGPVYQQLLDRIARDETEIMQLIDRNHATNNGFFINFFGYYNAIQLVLQRNRIPPPEAAIELGTGTKPFTALRFLLEGTRRIVVNDIMPIQSTFDRQFIASLRTLLTLVAPRLPAELDRLSFFAGDDGKVSIKGLDVHDREAFEEIDIDGRFDLIFSTSVLEHVMKPAVVVGRMASLLKPGGHLWHSIDLRDHRNLSRPLDFLMLKEEEYDLIKTENRLRLSDWIDLFADAGLQIIECEYGAWKSDNEPEYVFSFERPAPWVTDAQRASFSRPFILKELSDLSTLAGRVLCRKPA